MLSAMMETTPGRTNSTPAMMPPERAVHEPADVGGELLRLGAGQEHAVVQGMQEAVLADPALLLDDDAVHDRDLAGGAAEAEQRDAQPDPEGLAAS